MTAEAEKAQWDALHPIVTGLHYGATKAMEAIIVDVLASLPPAKPLTRRQKIKRWVRSRPTVAMTALHDALFGTRYCDHDGCY